jgi:transcriptional regulator with XRE-family HTH domain
MNNTAEQQIGQIIEDARTKLGYDYRSDFVNTKTVRGKLTQEGLRKIERGERVPRMETLHLLGNALGLSKRRIRKLEEMALKKHVERATKRAGNVDVTINLEGEPIKVKSLPAKKKVYRFVQEAVDELAEIVYKYGVFDQDVEHFRQHAKEVLYKKLL